MQTVTDELRPDQGGGVRGTRGYLARNDAARARRALQSYGIAAGRWFGLEPTDQRREAILRLSRKDWHGRIVFALTCELCGAERFVGEPILWHLIRLDHFTCRACLRGSRQQEESMRP